MDIQTHNCKTMSWQNKSKQNKNHNKTQQYTTVHNARYICESQNK